MAESNVASVEHLPSAVVVHVLSSQLGKSEVDGLCSATDAARGTAPTLPFILDMAKVGFAGSLAIGVLVGLHKEFQNRGQRLIFVGLQANLRDSFKVTRMNQILEILPDVPTALQSVESRA
jgi:anti-anti-sigma factor